MRILNVTCEERLFSQVDDFRFRRKLETRSEAIRKLLELGLAADKQKKGEGDGK